jgi:PKD repeat protein
MRMKFHFLLTFLLCVSVSLLAQNQKDMSVIKVLTPQATSKCKDTIYETVRVVVKNQGTQDVTGYSACMTEDGFPSCVNNLSLKAGAIDTVDFYIYPSAPGDTVRITGHTVLNTDQNHANDTVKTSFVSSPVPRSVFMNFKALNRLCGGPDTADYSVREFPTYTYKWSASGGSIVGSNTKSSVKVYWPTFSGGTVTVTATNSAGCSWTKSQTVKVTQFEPGYKLSSREVCEGEYVYFEDTSKIVNDTIRFSLLSCCGPGTSHGIFYAKGTAGIKPFYYLVTTGQNCSAQLYDTITVHPLPTVDFSVGKVCAGQPVTFMNKSTVSSGTVKYFWISDTAGAKDTSTAINPTFTYSSPGSYAVVLVAMSDKGCTASDTQTVTVLTTPGATFSATINKNKVTFLASDTTLTSYSWDFGDSILSSSAKPVHTYQDTGVFEVKLTVTNSSGCSSVYSKSVHISELVGIAEKSKNSRAVQIYPNPFSDRFNVEYTAPKSGLVSVKLLSTTGQVVFERSFTHRVGTEVYSMPIDKDKMNNGIYFLMLRTDDEMVVRKVIYSK